MPSLLVFLLFQANLHVAYGVCGCMCVEGIPKTLCSTVAEAKANPNRCLSPVCPAFDPTESLPTLLEPPFENVENCREVRVWDESENAHRGVKVCDIAPDAG